MICKCGGSVVENIYEFNSQKSTVKIILIDIEGDQVERMKHGEL